MQQQEEPEYLPLPDELIMILEERRKKGGVDSPSIIDYGKNSPFSS